jgi:hypothetical protein
LLAGGKNATSGVDSIFHKNNVLCKFHEIILLALADAFRYRVSHVAGGARVGLRTDPSNLIRLNPA